MVVVSGSRFGSGILSPRTTLIGIQSNKLTLSPYHQWLILFEQVCMAVCVCVRVLCECVCSVCVCVCVPYTSTPPKSIMLSHLRKPLSCLLQIGVSPALQWQKKNKESWSHKEGEDDVLQRVCSSPPPTTREREHKLPLFRGLEHFPVSFNVNNLQFLWTGKWKLSSQSSRSKSLYMGRKFWVNSNGHIYLFLWISVTS